MGSKSDLPVVKEAADVLTSLGVPNKMFVMSAHRTPEMLSEFMAASEENGYGVFIAAAGKAAHLAGVVAAQTVRPVIGLPIKSSTMDGLDSLLSTVQMPSGIPVATVAINGAKNAGLLAAEILALSDDELKTKLLADRKRMADAIEADNASLQ